MNFLEIIKPSLISDYNKCENVNNSLLKEIASGNIKAIQYGTPNINSTYMDFGSYVDKTIEDNESPEVYEYPHVVLSGHTQKLYDELNRLNEIDASEDRRLEVTNDLKLWSTTKKDDLRRKLVNSSELIVSLDREKERVKGKYVISDTDFKIANYILNTLYTHEYSKNIINPPLKVKSYTQLAIKFTIDKIPIKVLLDILLVNHKDKTLEPIDLKTGSKENFLDNYYKYKYWLQGSLYYTAIMHLISKYKELSDYKILPFKFLYISREKPDLPLIHELNKESVSKYMEGYINDKGEYRRGVIDFLKDYKFHKETGIYDRSREVYENQGVLKLPTPQ